MSLLNSPLWRLSLSQWPTPKWPLHYSGQPRRSGLCGFPRPAPSLLGWMTGSWAVDVTRRPRSSPVLFFPEMHEELTKLWKAPLSARSRYANSPSLTTFDGVRQGDIQRSPRACKFSSALVVKAYAASGQAVSALHTMAILQVYQAKILKDLHEGFLDPELLQELRSTTDYALRTTKVTAQALGRAMSNMVVQERHLWLNLAEMRDAGKVRFLDAPISQAGLFGKTMEEFAQQFSAVKQQTEAIKHILPRHAVSASPAPPKQKPLPAPRQGRPPTRTAQALQPAGPAARPTQQSSIRRKPREEGSFDLSGSTLDEGTSAGFGFGCLPPGRRPPHDNKLVQTISLLRGILCSALTAQTPWAKQPVVSRPGYVPKVPTTPFRDQVVTLQAISSQENDPNLNLLCPVRALRIYMEQTQPFRHSEQLFVCYGGQKKGKAVSKQRISHWLVNVIRTAYQARGLPCPLGVRAHSTKGVAASAALGNGASLKDICRVAGWATPKKFARFYNLCLESVSVKILNTNS
ncbi:Chitin synthase 3 [Labeo rohita]|uniref:Chitin synthase 3 n=1 Tax=Labeo rohita TaxID=84645 RepID=A0ABQ8LAC7_LABRO|nr:Chitin synthase 3 [Labeo rohita]